jgi:hypothetical protein
VKPIKSKESLEKVLIGAAQSRVRVKSTGDLAMDYLKAAMKEALQTRQKESLAHKVILFLFLFIFLVPFVFHFYLSLNCLLSRFVCTPLFVIIRDMKQHFQEIMNFGPFQYIVLVFVYTRISHSHIIVATFIKICSQNIF